MQLRVEMVYATSCLINSLVCFTGCWGGQGQSSAFIPYYYYQHGVILNKGLYPYLKIVQALSKELYANNYTLLKSSYKLRYSPYTGITIVTVHKGLNQPLLGCCLRHELLLVSAVVQWAGRLHKEATNVPPSKQVATKLMWQQLNSPIKYVHETF